MTVSVQNWNTLIYVIINRTWCYYLTYRTTRRDVWSDTFIPEIDDPVRTCVSGPCALPSGSILLNLLQRTNSPKNSLPHLLPSVTEYSQSTQYSTLTTWMFRITMCCHWSFIFHELCTKLFIYWIPVPFNGCYIIHLSPPFILSNVCFFIHLTLWPKTYTST